MPELDQHLPYLYQNVYQIVLIKVISSKVDLNLKKFSDILLHLCEFIAISMKHDGYSVVSWTPPWLWLKCPWCLQITPYYLPVYKGKKTKNMKNLSKTNLLSAKKVKKMLDKKSWLEKIKSIKSRITIEYFFDFYRPIIVLFLRDVCYFSAKSQKKYLIISRDLRGKSTFGGGWLGVKGGGDFVYNSKWTMYQITLPPFLTPSHPFPPKKLFFPIKPCLVIPRFPRWRMPKNV